METRIAELRYKEVISVEDGSRFGYVGDMEVDMDTGQVRALVVPGLLRRLLILGTTLDLGRCQLRRHIGANHLRVGPS